MKAFRIPLRVVFYQEEGEWIAHCLEFDLCGDGESKAAALESLADAINLQVDFSLKHNSLQNLFTPAPSEIQEKFFAGKNSDETALGRLELRVDRLVIEEPEYREYSDELSESGVDRAFAYGPSRMGGKRLQFHDLRRILGSFGIVEDRTTGDHVVCPGSGETGKGGVGASEC
jgi:predicted RNase H-like HicB family nuclease